MCLQNHYGAFPMPRVRTRTSVRLSKYQSKVYQRTPRKYIITFLVIIPLLSIHFNPPGGQCSDLGLVPDTQVPIYIPPVYTHRFPSQY